MLITTLVVSVLVFCMLEVRCGWARVGFGLEAQAQSWFAACNEGNSDQVNSIRHRQISALGRL